MRKLPPWVKNPKTDFGLGKRFPIIWGALSRFERGALEETIRRLARGKDDQRVLREIVREELTPYIEKDFIRRALKLNRVYREKGTGRSIRYLDGCYREVKDEYYWHLRDLLLNRINHLSKKPSDRKRIIDRAKELVTSQPEIELNLHPNLLNLSNGVLNMEDGSFSKHSPSFHFSYRLPVVYDPACSAPNWERALKDYLDAEDRTELQKMFFYILSGQTSAQKLFYFVGDGRDGKSTVARVLEELLGSDLVQSLPLSALRLDHFSVGELSEKLLNISSEIGKDRRLPEQTLKVLTGEDRINAERKYRSTIGFRNRARLLILSNQVPKLEDLSRAMIGRIKFFRFKGLANQEDSFFEKRLGPELSGILNWAIQGYELFNDQGGFVSTTTDLETLRETELDSQPVRRFFGEHPWQDYVQRQPSRGRQYLDTELAFHDFDEWRKKNREPERSNLDFRKEVLRHLQSLPEVLNASIEPIHIPRLQRNARAILFDHRGDFDAA